MSIKEDSHYTPEAITGRVLKSVTARHSDVSEDQVKKVVNKILEGATVPNHVDIFAAREIEEGLLPADRYQQAPEETLSEALTPITIFDRATHAASGAINKATNVISTASRKLRLG